MKLTQKFAVNLKKQKVRIAFFSVHFCVCLFFSFTPLSPSNFLVEVDALKLAPHNHWGMRHRRDSISGLSIHSQPLGIVGGSGGGGAGGGGTAYGTQSPAPTYHSQGKVHSLILCYSKNVIFCCSVSLVEICFEALKYHNSRCALVSVYLIK